MTQKITKTLNIEGRTITNLRFADDIDDLAGDQCRKDQVDDKRHRQHQQGDQSKWTEAYEASSTWAQV